MSYWSKSSINSHVRSQWPSLELVDHKFRGAVLLAWGSVREVDIERDFTYSESKAIKAENDHNSEMIKGRLRLQIAQRTEAILKELYERSPFITSLIGLSLIAGDPSLNTTAVQYLAGFEFLDTVKFAHKHVLSRMVNGGEPYLWCCIPLINFIEFMESTQSRATLKVIDIEQCTFFEHPFVVANYDQRLRAAFANVSGDPTRQLLRLESFSMQMIDMNYPLTFLDNIDASKLSELSLGRTAVEPAALTRLINGAPQLQHLDFAFLRRCKAYDNTPSYQGGRLQPNKDLLAALKLHQKLTSLGFNRIWYWLDTCACHRFETEFKKMLRTIGPQLVNFVFKPSSLPPDIRMGEIRDIIQHHMPHLKSIALDDRCAENPEDLRGIADGKELEEINITAYSRHNNYQVILNEVVSTILTKSPRVKRFNGINYYPDQRVAVELCKLSDLIDLRIRANELTEEHFAAFSQQVFAEKLEILHLGTIGPGVEAGLIELIAKATQLRELIVDRNVTDKLLECLAESCPNLEKFTAFSAVGITLGGVEMLVDRCPKLRWLRISTDGTPASSVKNMKLDRFRNLELF